MERKFKRRYLEFQEDIVRIIVKNFIEQNGKGIYIEVARQGGKTTVVVECVAVLAAIAKKNWNIPAIVGVFAPQKEQAKTDFDRTKVALKQLYEGGLSNALAEENNRNTIILADRASEYYAFSLENGTNIEGKSNSLQIFEEAQKMHGPKVKKMKVEAFPMAAAYNAPRIFIGSGGYHISHFYTGIQNNLGNKETLFRYPYKQIIEQKEFLYKITGDKFHLKYKEFIEGEIENLGEESDEFKSQYSLIWNLERGMFTTKTAMLKMCIDKPMQTSEKTYPCFAGIDVGKKHDSTACSIVRFVSGKWVRIALKTWQGDNYSHQFKELMKFLENFKIEGLAIDSTGQGDWLPDRFDDESDYEPIHFVFTRQSKDKLFKNLMAYFEQGNFRWLKPDNERLYNMVMKQYIELEKEYKGEYLSVHHPDNDKDAHDDIPDADALAVWAGKEYFGGQINSNQIEFNADMFYQGQGASNNKIDYEN